jgi:predicted transcriptional regulator
MKEQKQLLSVFKALADASRLKIIGLLSERPSSVEEIASMLNLRPSTVSHHLSKLAEAGLVSARAESYYNIYSLEKSQIERIGRELLARQVLPEIAAGVDMDAYDRKVLRDFSLSNGRLKAIPAQRKKREIILRHIAQSFEPGRRYPEREVVAILEKFHEDTALLRRELIGYGFLERQNNMYWLPDLKQEGDSE